MLARLWIYWARVRDSLWFLPGVLTILASILAIALTEAERAGIVNPPGNNHLVFGGGVEGARGVLNAIAGGLITVTGVVFSVTIVALQLASSQFTPRVLRNFTADRGNQAVLAVFIATFTYTLLVLRTVRSAAENLDPFVPQVAVTLAVVLVLVSIGFLIFFINHSARSIQVSSILERVAERTLNDVERLFPEPVGEPDPERVPDPSESADAAMVMASGSGYLQAVDAAALFRLGRRSRVVISMLPHIGDFILPGEPLACVSPPDEVDDELTRAVRKAFVLGPERTPGQDVEFGIIEISDIAIKALSPGINDPTTAFRCIDRLGQVVLALARRGPPERERTEHGHVHYIARYTTFERALGLAFDQVRHFGASNPAVVKKLLETLTTLQRLAPAECGDAVRAQLSMVRRGAREMLETRMDRAAVQEADARLRD